MVKVIGLTGGIATGKSTVTKYLRKVGYVVLDADEFAHHAYDDQPCRAKIIEAFGEADRVKIGQIVFHDRKARGRLEDIIHPYVREEIQKAIDTSTQKILFIDVPLLFEAHFDELCQAIIVVSASQETELERLMARNHLSRQEALTRIQAQMPLSEKVKRATYVIDNSFDRMHLRKEIERVLKEIRSHV